MAMPDGDPTEMRWCGPTFKSFGRMNSEGAGGYGNRRCIAAVGDRETELVRFDERLRKRR
jgi:hypothetical protein